MTRIRLSYVHEFLDRHGKVRRYFRRPGFKQVPLPGLPGSAEFMEAYAEAFGTAQRVEIGASRSKPGTIAALTAAYLASIAFGQLADETRRTRRNILERFRAEHGDKRVATLQRMHVERMVGTKAATPAAARNFLNTLRAMMQFAVEIGIRHDDPTLGVKRIKIRTEGYRTWSEEDIAAFEAAHPIGTRARLALALLLCTAQRRSDVVRIGRQHVRGGMIHVRQRKTGTTLAIPVHLELQRVLDATPGEHLTFLTTAAGKPFTPAGFTNWFRQMCNEAGLPTGTSAHGLRKAACRRLAEAGCSANEIAAISGHATLREIERYTKAADQARMARAAMGRLPLKDGS
jgi:integrase